MFRYSFNAILFQWRCFKDSIQSCLVACGLMLLGLPFIALLAFADPSCIRQAATLIDRVAAVLVVSAIFMGADLAIIVLVIVYSILIAAIHITAVCIADCCRFLARGNTVGHSLV